MYLAEEALVIILQQKCYFFVSPRLARACMFHVHIFDLTTNLAYNQVLRTYSVRKLGSISIRQVLHSSQNAYNSE